MENIITTIITGVVTLAGVVITARATRDKVTHTLEIKNAVQQKEIDDIKDDISEMKVDIKTHNNYARLFSETMPVVQEQIRMLNHQVETIEHKIS